MGEVIGFKRDDEEDILIIPNVFDFAIVPEAVFTHNPICPHCQTAAQPELMESPERYEGHHLTLLGDLMICTDCNMTYLVVEFPIISHPVPIMTKWKVPHKIIRR